MQAFVQSAKHVQLILVRDILYLHAQVMEIAHHVWLPHQIARPLLNISLIVVNLVIQ